MRQLFPEPLIYILFVMVFPLVRWAQRPVDALATCEPASWRMDADGRLSCGRGRPLTATEELALGRVVNADDLTEDDWSVLVGRTLAGRLEARRQRGSRICRWRLSELGDELPNEVLLRLPENLHCEADDTSGSSGGNKVTGTSGLKKRGD